jgi:hypothetical protein
MRSKKFMLFVTVVLLTALNGWSQSSKNVNLTCGLSNGRAWRAFGTVETKLVFLVAYREGVIAGTVAARHGKTNLKEDLSYQFPAELTWEETATALDHLYDFPENRPIPISNALQIVTLQSAGVSKGLIEKDIEDFRHTEPCE